MPAGAEPATEPDGYAELAELAGGFIHEIKNHLSTLGLNLQLLAEDFQDPQSQRERRAMERVQRLQTECQRLVDEGHEIGHHGYCHENPRRLEIEKERAILERGIALIENLTGRAPQGYRAPAGSFSPNTL